MTLQEPAITTPKDLRRPDRLVRTRNHAAVLDAQIIADNGDPKTAHGRKVAYYDNPAIGEHTSRSLGVDPENVRFDSITLNWRGAWSDTSADHPIELVLRPRQLKLMFRNSLQQPEVDDWQSSSKTTHRRPGEIARPTAGESQRTIAGASLIQEKQAIVSERKWANRVRVMRDREQMIEST